MRWSEGLECSNRIALFSDQEILNQPIRLPGLKPGVCSGLILSGPLNPDLKIGVWRRRTYQQDLFLDLLKPIIPVFQYSNIPVR